MDDALIDHLARTQKSVYQHPVADAFLLIVRYLTANSRERMMRIYKSQTIPCHAEMIAYFLRVKPEEGEKLLRREPWEMHGIPGQCVALYIGVIPRLMMTPGVEKFLAAHLWHEDVQIKSAAARMLSLFGTAAAKKPLWDAYRFFHEYWKDRQSEVTPGINPNAQLEEALRTALARGRGWLVNETELKQIEALCITDQCKYEGRSDLRSVRPTPLAVELSFRHSEMRAQVAQYYWLDGLDALQSWPRLCADSARRRTSSSTKNTASEVLADTLPQRSRLCYGAARV